MELTLSSPVQYLPRVGPKMAKKLEKLGINSVEDLLFYAPFRYNDYSLVSPIARVQPGETVTIAGTVESIKNIYTKTGKKIQQATVVDASGRLEIVWFNQPFLVRTIRPGEAIHLAGLVSWFGPKIVMSSPEYELTGASTSLHTGRLVPVYSETEGMSSKWLRGRIAFALAECKKRIFEYMPDTLIKRYNLVPIQKALEDIHYPPNERSAKAARERLAFDELFILLLRTKTDITAFIRSLPFELTGDQKNCVEDILRDLSGRIPMNRLLEGDVGAGKTVVAAIAMFAVGGSGYRSALMAPTEILAQQHYETLEQFLQPMGIQIALVTGSQKKSPKDKNIDVFVGTHALLTSSLPLERIGLIVIDEQQRFGVAQRALLRTRVKGRKTPHLLTMTATPIPRTIAQTIYSNLDLSILVDMPEGRQMVKTWVVPKEKRTSAYAWIRKQLKDQGSQAFIVCPLIEESETMTSAKAATTEYERLRKNVFSDLQLGLLHGRLGSKVKTRVLGEFRKRHYDILVTTPVVEVGIDLPNATIMMVEAAERFGLAQLHQLRGRVGRGKLASFCLLFTDVESEPILKRLKALERIHNGPQLAELDLTIRGPGDILGVRQHGLPGLKIARLGDLNLIQKAKEAVKSLVQKDADLAGFPLLRQKLQRDTIESVALD